MDIQEKMYELYGYGSETNWRKVKGYITAQEVADLIGKITRYRSKMVQVGTAAAPSAD